MANRVYTGYWEKLINAGALFQSNFDIVSANREMKIKSIFTSLQIIENPTGNRIDWQASISHKYALYIFANAAANAFNYVSGQTFSDNGNYIVLWTPQQIHFDSFFVKNSLSIQVNIRNSSAVQAQYSTSIIIETEENIIYQ